MIQRGDTMQNQPLSISQKISLSIIKAQLKRALKKLKYTSETDYKQREKLIAAILNLTEPFNITDEYGATVTEAMLRATNSNDLIQILEDVLTEIQALMDGRVLPDKEQLPRMPNSHVR